MPFPSSIDTLKNGLDKKILISTSNFSKILQTPAAIALKEASEKLNPAYLIKNHKHWGFYWREFNSAFENRIPPIKLEKKRTSGKSQLMVFPVVLWQKTKLIRAIPLELGYDKWTNNFYSNKIFLQQTVHYLMGNQKLLKLQNKSIELPQLDFQKKLTINFFKDTNVTYSINDSILMGGLVYRWRITKI